MKVRICVLVVIALTSVILFSCAESKKPAADRNYQNVRIKKFPLAMQCWTYRKYSFLETLEKVEKLGIEYLQAYPGQVLKADNPDVKFDHHLSEKQIEKVLKKLKEHGISLVSYGVVNLGNTEAGMREVFDFARKMGIRIIVTEPEGDDYSLLEKMIDEYNIQIAIHNHPEPSKYARPEVVLQHVRGRDARIGSCADTGHWMRGGIPPIKALRMLQGRIIDVHIKDRNAFGTEDAYDVPFGQGKANIHDILAELTLQNYHGYLTIEYENEDEVYHPEPAILKGIEYIRSITYYEDYEEILAWRNGRYAKHGWNHYGPGYFELDEKTGMLKSQGGMGLLWYSAKKYSDFILELDFQCLDKTANSGVFVRVPEIPTSDDYIYQTLKYGRPGTEMKVFFGPSAPTKISHQDACDIIAYLRSLKQE